MQKPIFSIITIHYENIFATFGYNSLTEIEKALNGQGTTAIKLIIDNLISTYGYNTILKYHNEVYKKVA